MSSDTSSSQYCKTTNNLLHKEPRILAVGDIFQEEFLPLPACISKSWHINLPPTETRTEHAYKICFRHGMMNGRWVLIINGVVKGMGYENVVKTRKFQVEFMLYEDKPSKLVCDGLNSLKYKYMLYIEDILQPIEDSSPQRAMVECLPMLVSIPDTRTCTPNESDSKSITFYQILVQFPGDKSIMIERRFSEFMMLDDAMRCLLDQKLCAMLPYLPSKLQVYTPIFGQKIEDFIASRREALEAYIRFLLGNKKTRYYTEVLSFFGLDPISGNPIQVSDPDP